MRRIRNLEIQTDHPIPFWRADLESSSKKKRIYHLVDFAVPVDHRVKINESKKEINKRNCAT